MRSVSLSTPHHTHYEMADTHRHGGYFRPCPVVLAQVAFTTCCLSRAGAVTHTACTRKGKDRAYTMTYSLGNARHNLSKLGHQRRR